MSFRFPLTSLLRVRESVEKREETALQAIQSEISQLHRSIGDLNVEIAQGSRTLQASLQQPQEARQMQLTLREIERNVVLRRDLLLKLEVWQQKRKVQLKAYRAAARDRHVLSEMHAQKRAEYDQRQERAQQKFLDDIFTSRSQSR